MENILQAAELIRRSAHTTAFSGAGISVESGIPPFRGENGLWSKYDPAFLEIGYFLNNPESSWRLIKEIFYDFFGKARPNAGHYALARMEEKGFIQALITQNIDYLHQQAGSRAVYEFHGASRTLICLTCKRHFNSGQTDLSRLPPHCPHCGGLLKPDFIFFGEAIPEPASTLSYGEAEQADIFLVIGTTGEIMPAAMIPPLAKRHGARIIEINTQPSKFTRSITDIFIRAKAGEALSALAEELGVNDQKS